MVIYVDIDNTICHTPDTFDYTQSTPIKENIDKINKLFDEGNIIIYWTARGTKSGMNWRELTEYQFSQWGVKCHELLFGKPAYDLMICDKTKRIEEI